MSSDSHIIIKAGEFPRPRITRKNKIKLLIDLKKKYEDDFYFLLTESIYIHPDYSGFGTREENNIISKIYDEFEKLKSIQKSNNRLQMRKQNLFTENEILILLPKKTRKRNNYFTDFAEAFNTYHNNKINKATEPYEISRWVKNLTYQDFLDIRDYIQNKHSENKEKLYKRSLGIIKYLKSVGVKKELREIILSYNKR